MQVTIFLFLNSKNEINANDLNIDFIYNENERVVVKSRMEDKGTIKSNIIYDNIFEKFDLKIGGVGFLFDKISNQLTKEVFTWFSICYIGDWCLFLLYLIILI